jgi:serpin B
MKRWLYVTVISAALVATLGCSAPEVTAQVVKSDKPRDTAPKTTAGSVNALVDGNSAFALSLYQSVRTTEGNIFFSPYSISEAMAMTWAGARGQTESDIGAAMHFTLSQDKLHPAFNQLDLALASRGQGAKGKDGQGFRLHVVNAIWGQQGYKFASQYLDTLATNYGAGLRLADFIKQPDASRVIINDWVANQTENRIKDLIPAGSINTLTRLVLTNAIYFNAAWLQPFQKSATAQGTFHRLSNGDVSIPMMRQTASFGYNEGADYQATEMLYDGGELSMIAILPKAGMFGDFEKTLDGPTLKAILDGLKTREVALTMPKFQFEMSLGLKQALTGLGMGVAFADAADFSGMNGGHDLRIQDVLHKAFIAVDEDGTEAAAASAVIVGTTAMPVDVAEMKIDRPFLFLIRDNATGTILFLGRVSDPSAK